MVLALLRDWLAMAPPSRPQPRAQYSPLWQQFRARKTFGSLDGLRAISIVAVIWHHAARGRSLPFAEQGALGVAFFFAISGFLITTLLLREQERRGTISLRNFYARRSLRIFPLYYTVLLAYFVIVYVLERSTLPGQQFFHNLRYFATYTSNWFVPLDGRVIFYFAWSLATEEQFYLTWPSVEKFSPRPVRVLLPLALIAAWYLAASELMPLGHDSFARSLILSIAPAICMGVVLAHLLHSPATFTRLARFLAPPWSAPLLLGALVMLLAVHAPLLLIFLCMTLLVGACVAREDHYLESWLRWPPLASIGQTSYGIYLLHMLALNLVERSTRLVNVNSLAVVFPLTLLAAWGTAWLSYRHYEARFLRLKSRFTA